MALIDAVDPFIGTGVTQLPPPTGLAATWWFPKPQIGNTHPGAVAPLGMVSACAYSGAYPTGYGLHDLNTQGVPTPTHDHYQASGFTHFQQSGTGAIRKYYNYLRVTPMVEPLSELGRRWALEEETAEPGYYAATLDSGVRCELTVGHKSAIHRYTFPSNRDARVVMDFSNGGLEIEHGRTVPVRAHLHTVGPDALQGEVVVEGVPLAVHIECHSPGWRQSLWYDRRVMAGGSRLDFESIRQTTLRPFGALFEGKASPGTAVELRIGFSLRGVDQAERNLRTEIATDQTTARQAPAAPTRSSLRRPSTEAGPVFDDRRWATRQSWSQALGTIEVEGGSADRRTVFATALYHSLIKPSFAPDESPFWPADGPFVFDICTMWDIYKTQLPLLLLLAPERAEELLHALLQVSVEEGNLPIGYRMARGADRFFRQASALAHTFFADAQANGIGEIDWDWALVHLTADLRRSYGEDFLIDGLAHPISHTLDLAYGYHCTAKVADAVGDRELADQLDGLATRWRNAFDPTTGLLIDSTYYEGGRWNYSFRLLHDMAARIELAGGEVRFAELLDQFFGFDAPPVKQLGQDPSAEEVAAGYALNRFEGLNNEPDIEAPWAYHYIGRPDRTAQIVHAVLSNQFGTGRGGLPGNDDSGGLSSWYVWASLGLFPVAGQNLFLLNAPAFRRSRIGMGPSSVPGGELTIEAEGFNPRNAEVAPQYVAAAWLDDQPLDRTWITGTELRRASTIRLQLADEPTGWADGSRPPSLTAPNLPPTTT
ncbi:MAG: GH92 family glycosyl hydrolase [Actinomycetota bacterium]